MAEELAAERGGKKPAGSEKHMMWGEVFAFVEVFVEVNSQFNSILNILLRPLCIHHEKFGLALKY